MSLFTSKSLKIRVAAYFVLTSLFISSSLLHGADTAPVDDTAIDLKLNLNKGDKFNYKDSCEFSVFVDLPAEFIKDVKEDTTIDPISKKMFIDPVAEAISQKKPLLIIKAAADDEATITEVSPAKDRFTFNYSLTITDFLFQEFVQGNKISFDLKNPENNSLPADFPLTFKDPKAVFPIVFGAVFDQKGHLVRLIELTKAGHKLVDNLSSPMLTEEMTNDAKAKINEIAAEKNEQIKEFSADSFTFYPPNPVKVNDSWIVNLAPQLDAEWKEELAKPASEEELELKKTGRQVFDKFTQVKCTLKSRVNGIATVQFEMAQKNDVFVELPFDYKVEVSGNIVEGVVEFNESNGIIVSIKSKTDLLFKMTFTGDETARKKTDPQYAEIRLVGSGSSSLVK